MKNSCVNDSLTLSCYDPYTTRKVDFAISLMLSEFDGIFHFHVTKPLHFLPQKDIHLQRSQIQYSNSVSENFFSFFVFSWETIHRDP